MLNFATLTNKKKNQFTKRNDLPYQIFLIIVGIMYLGIFAVHIFSPNEGRYLAAENGETIETEGHGTFKVINRTYDKSSKKYQVILWLVSDANVKEDYQLEMKATSVIQSDSQSKKESEVVRIGRQYFSIVVSDVPEEYEAIRTDIEVEKQTISDDQESTGSVKLYSRESQTEGSVIDISPEFYELQERKIQVSELGIEIKKIKKDIKESQNEIDKIVDLQESIRQDMVIQVGEERESSEQAIQDYQVDIANKNETIEVNKQRQDELEEKKNRIEAEI